VSKIKAVVFDMDGTLYNQNFLRMLVMLKMFQQFVLMPKKFLDELKVIKEFRKIQEELRESDSVSIDENSQIKLTADRLKLNFEDVMAIVKKWFYEIPLPLISICKRKNVNKVFSELKSQGYLLGLYSDYPPVEKAGAVGIKDYLDSVVCSSDADVGKFKPAAKGFFRIAEKLKLNIDEIIYVGDRVSVDIKGAKNAGMIPLLIGKFNFGKKDYASCYSFGSITDIVNKLNTH